MATARNVGTAGCIFFINFAHIWLQVIAFWGGPIALHGLVHFSTRLGPPLLESKVVYAYFDRISYHVCVCVHVWNHVFVIGITCVQ